MTNSREKVAQAGSQLLQVFQTNYTEEELLGPCLKATETVRKPKSKIAVINLLARLIPKCKEHFESQFTVKQIVQKMAVMLAEASGNKAAAAPCLNVLNIVREINSSVVIGSIIDLPMNLQNNLRSLAGEYSPELEESIRKYIFEHNGLKLDTSTADEGDQSLLSKKKHSKNVVSVDKILSATMTRKPRNSGVEDTRSPTSSSKKERVSSKASITNKSVDLRDIRAKSPTPDYTPKANSKILPDDIEIADKKPPTKPLLKKDGNKASHKKLPPSGPAAEDVKPKNFDLQTIENLITNFNQNKKTWNSCSQEILENLIRIISESGPKVLELALDMFSSLLNLDYNWEKHSSIIVEGLTKIKKIHSTNKHIDAIWSDQILPSKIRIAAIQALINSLQDDGDVQLLAVKTEKILQAFSVLEEDEIEPSLTLLMEKYHELINSQNAEVRKLVVLSIVDLHSLFSEGFDEYIQEFTAAQQKIIQIYLKRRLEKNK